MAIDQHSLALLQVRAGRPREARAVLAGIVDYLASSGNTAVLCNSLELAATIAAGLGAARQAARLIGAAEALRRESGMQISEQEAAMLEELLRPARVSAPLEPEAWDAELSAGLAFG